jgi:hypothetical protein
VTISPIHLAAIESVEAAFSKKRVAGAEQPDGTTLVTVTGVDIGERWTPSTVSMTVPLAITFPTTPPYPYFVDDGMQLAGVGVPSNMKHGIAVAGRTYSQVSLSNRDMRSDETLAERLIAAIAWFRSQ